MRICGIDVNEFDEIEINNSILCTISTISHDSIKVWDEQDQKRWIPIKEIKSIKMIDRDYAMLINHQVRVKVQEMGLTHTYEGKLTNFTNKSIFIDDEEIFLDCVKDFGVIK